MRPIPALIALGCLLAGSALAQPAPVKLGVLEDMAGPTSYLNGQGSVDAAQLAADDFGGKVIGRPIVVMSADHQQKPAVGAAIARRWIDEQGVDVLLDIPNSDIALAVDQVIAEKHRLAIFVGAVTDRISEQDCNPYAMQWGLDTYADSQTVRPLIKSGFDSFFFLTSDYVFGHTLEDAARSAIAAAGGKVLGSVTIPLETTDYSSFLVQAQASGAKVVALLISGGSRLVTAFKQAREFGLSDASHKVTSLHIYTEDVHTLGLPATQGLEAVVPFYWNRDAASRAFSERYKARFGHLPSELHAGVYSATLAYLKGVEKAGTTDAAKVRAAMAEITIDDVYAQHATLLANGRLIHDLYLVQVKTPAESKDPWDYFNLVATIPAAEAFRPLSQSLCPLVKH
ncbi:MAG: ABC transporter substrate-binding protein [Acidisphaera sp.]|nr:ABC transporter substrate-binding protein [Acidisphaera sp.]